jgi:ketosteroid isomerase-like protein
MINRDAETQSQIETLERRFIEACLKNDTRVLDSILAEDFVFTDPSGVNLTKQEWLADLASGDFIFEAVEIEGLRVNLREDTAMVYVSLRLKAQAKKAAYAGTYSAMDVYENREGEWKMILSTANRGNV